MYSNEERQRAIELLIQYDGQVTQTIRELGCPSRAMLKQWKKEYLERGSFTGKRVHGKAETYSAEQKRAAVNYYLKHGKCIAKTVRALGYPKAKFLLSRWIDEIAPQEKRVIGAKVARDKAPQVSVPAKHKHTPKEQSEHEVIQEFYNWRAYVAPRVKIVPRTYVLAGDDVKRPKTLEEADKILKEQQKQIEESQATLLRLQEQIRKQQLTLDVMQATYDVLKKGMGTDPKRLTNKEKTIVINALRLEKGWPLGCLLIELNIAKSSYEYQARLLTQSEKQEIIELKERIKEACGVYGYRRLLAKLNSKSDTKISEWKLRTYMKELGLYGRTPKRKHYNSYVGETSKASVNTCIDIDRKHYFKTGRPHILWLLIAQSLPYLKVKSISHLSLIGLIACLSFDL